MDSKACNHIPLDAVQITCTQRQSFLLGHQSDKFSPVSFIWVLHPRPSPSSFALVQSAAIVGCVLGIAHLHGNEPFATIAWRASEHPLGGIFFPWPWLHRPLPAGVLAMSVILIFLWNH
jgi:hypothetical protein